VPDAVHANDRDRALRFSRLKVDFSKTFHDFSNHMFLCILTDLNAFRCVNAVALSAEGKSLASANDDHTVRI
jgi:hypothetical protein